MGSRLRDMIRAIRACKTAAEERAVVKKECAAIRTSFNESDQDYYRHRNLAKLMFIHMLGYPTHFGQMECLKLIAYTGFPEKRIGYLGLMILLDERQEVLMLVTNSLKNDLNHTNQFICGLALCALGNICSAEMARDLATEVEKLLQSNISYIKKKAALCAVRIVRKVPDLAENFMKHATKLLSDKPHGVLVAGVKLCTELCISSPVALKHFRKQTPSLVRILKNIVTSGYAPEYDVGGITDPFLQIRILRLLRLVGHEDTNASDAMSDVLAQVATNTESNKNAGNAILYACVRTIMDIEDVGGLRVLAVNILGRFLSNRDNNIRYVALTTLMKVVGVDTQAVQRHRSTILECVKDTDISIRRRALDLVYALVNESNAKMLTKELVDHLKSSDPEFKAELTEKICLIVDKFSPDKLWYIDQMVNVLAEAGKCVTNEVVHTFLVVISNALDLQGYAVRSLYRCFQHWNGEESLAKVAAWCIGEYGDMLVNNTGLLDLEKPLVVAEADLVDVVETVLKDHRMSFETQAIALIALLKLSSRLPGCIERIKGLVLQNKRSFALELQQRSIEFSSILVKHDNLKATLVERMPVLDEAAFSAKRSDGTRAASGGSMNIISGIPAATLSNGSAKPSTNTLVDLLDLSANDSPALPPQSAGDLLQDLLGVEPSLFSTNVANSAQGSSGGSNILLDLLSLGPTPTATSEVAGIPSSLSGPMLTTQNSFTAIVDPLAMLGTSIPVLSQSAPMSASTSQKPVSTETGNGTLDTRLQSISPEPVIDLLADLNANVPTMTATEPAKYPSIIAYQSKALKVSFDFSKSPGKPQMTQIKATFTNLTSTQFTDFIFQAAVPKFMQLHLDPASGSLLPPTGSGVINQSLTVTNTLHGQKNMVMKIRIGYKINGQEVLEQGQASNFPSGL